MKRPHTTTSERINVSNGMETAPKKTHVMFLLPSLLPGGIEKHTLKLLKHFNREKFSFSLVTLFDRPNRPDLFSEVPDDVTVHRLAFGTGIDVSGWGKLYTLLKKERPDIVVSSMFSANTIVRLLKPFLGYRVVTREHNIYSEKNIFQRFVDMALSPLADATVAVSSSVADFFSKQAWMSRKKITVIHNGVDIEAINTFLQEKGEDEVQRVRHELGLKGGEKIILNVARLKPQKNHELLIGAFRLFVKENSTYHLVILGDGMEKERLLQLVADRGLKDVVHLLGYRSDAFSWYAASDFFVLTSKHEGFPNVGVEAMAFGVPLVSTSVAGVDEFLESGKNGQMVDSTVQSVCAGMISIASLSESERMAYRNHCSTTAQQFDIKTVTQKYEKLFVVR